MPIFFGSNIKDVYFGGGIKEVYYGPTLVWKKSSPIVLDGVIKGKVSSATSFNITIAASAKSITPSADGSWSYDVGNQLSGKAYSLYNMFPNAGISRTGQLSLDFSTFDFSRCVGSCQNMIYGLGNCTTITGLANKDWSHVTSMSNAIYNTGVLSLDITNMHLSSCTTCYAMFGTCSDMTSINMTGFSTSSALTDCSFMFNGCSSLVGTVDLTNMDVSGITTAAKMARMFNQCSSLTSIHGFPAFTVGHTAEDYCFNNCGSLVDFTMQLGCKYNVWMASCSALSRASVLSILTNYSQTSPVSGSGGIKFHNNVKNMISGDTELSALWTTAQSLGWSYA